MSRRAGATARWARYRRLWPELRKEVLPWVLGFVGNLVGCALLFAAFERLTVSVLQGLWFSLVSGTTTGYGDVLPDTAGGYTVAAWLLASSWVMDRMTTARLTKVLIEDPHRYTDAEQERDQAADELQLALLVQLARTQGLTPEAVPAWRRYDDAVAEVAREEAPV